MEGETMKKQSGPGRPPQTGTIVLFLRIPLEWDAQIEAIAQAEVRTKASIGKQAIKEYLERRQK
jgi:hypothetical protein